MKKVIKGVVYNTDTAEHLGSWDNGCNYTDFHYVEKTLCRTKKGGFFLHCEGGAATRYAHKSGSLYCEGEAIEPLSEQEALKWASDYLDGEKVEEIFGITEDLPEDTEPVTIMIAKEKADELKKEAESKNCSLSQLISEILDKQAV